MSFAAFLSVWQTATRTVRPAMSRLASRMPSMPRTAVNSMRSSGLPVAFSTTVRSAASMTPPVAPKMAPAPVASPSGLSNGLSGRSRKVRPTYLMSLMSSRVVRT